MEGLQVVLEEKAFQTKLSTRMNIFNGRKDRIPIAQREWLVKCWKISRLNVYKINLRLNEFFQGMVFWIKYTFYVKALCEKNKTTRSDQVNAV